MPRYVRDFIYMSDQKLAALKIQTRSIQHRPFRFRAEVKAPVVSLALESSDTSSADASASMQSEQVQLYKLKKALDEINKRSLWYSDTAAMTGSWIYFESPMNYCMLQSDYFPSAVVFADHMDLLPDPSVRILLHGSARHLLNQPRLVAISSEVERLQPSPSSGEFVYTLAENVAEVVRTIDASQDPLIAPPSARATDSLTTGIARLLRVLDQKFVVDTSAWLGGVARVTAAVRAPHGHGDVERFIMATPLYVEYTSDPEQG
jgi:hypothetical protein